MNYRQDVPPASKPGAWAAFCRVLGLLLASASCATLVACAVLVALVSLAACAGADTATAPPGTGPTPGHTQAPSPVARDDPPSTIAASDTAMAATASPVPTATPVPTITPTPTPTLTPTPTETPIPTPTLDPTRVLSPSPVPASDPGLAADFGDWVLDESCVAIARSPGIKATECVDSFSESEVAEGAVAVAVHFSSDGPMGARLRVVLERPPSARGVALGNLRPVCRPPSGCGWDVVLGEEHGERTTGGLSRLYFDRENWEYREKPKTRPVWMVGEYRVDVWSKESGELLASEEFEVKE